MKNTIKKSLSFLLLLCLLISTLLFPIAAVNEANHDPSFKASNIQKLKTVVITKGTYDSAFGRYALRQTITINEKVHRVVVLYYQNSDELNFVFGQAESGMQAVTMYMDSASESAYFKHEYTNGQANIIGYSSSFTISTFSITNMPEITIENDNQYTVSLIESAKELFNLFGQLGVMAWNYLLQNICGFELQAIGFYSLCVEHNYVITEIKAASCEENGIQKYYCTRCGYSYEEEIEKSGHGIINREGKCETCGKDVIDVSQCACSCHKDDLFSRFITAIKLFFWKIFGAHQYCDCGTIHY